MTAPRWAWLAFSGATLILLALDLLVFHRAAREASVRDAAGGSLVGERRVCLLPGPA